MAEGPARTQPSLAVLHFFLRWSCISPARSPVILVSWPSRCHFRREFTKLFIPKQLLSMCGSFSRGVRAPEFPNASEIRGNQGWEGGGGGGAAGHPPVAGCHFRAQADTFLGRSIPRPESRAAPAHASRCAFPALHYSSNIDGSHLQSFTAKAEEKLVIMGRED